MAGSVCTVDRKRCWSCEIHDNYRNLVKSFTNSHHLSTDKMLWSSSQYVDLQLIIFVCTVSSGNVMLPEEYAGAWSTDNDCTLFICIVSLQHSVSDDVALISSLTSAFVVVMATLSATTTLGLEWLEATGPNWTLKFSKHFLKLNSWCSINTLYELCHPVFSVKECSPVKVTG